MGIHRQRIYSRGIINIATNLNNNETNNTFELGKLPSE